MDVTTHKLLTGGCEWGSGKHVGRGVIYPGDVIVHEEVVTAPKRGFFNMGGAHVIRTAEIIMVP